MNNRLLAAERVASDLEWYMTVGLPDRQESLEALACRRESLA